LRGEHDLDPLRLQDTADLLCDIQVLAACELVASLDDRDATAEAPVSLRELETNVPAAEDDQMLREC
jgi:hypothetical protein